MLRDKEVTSSKRTRDSTALYHTVLRDKVDTCVNNDRNIVLCQRLRCHAVTYFLHTHTYKYLSGSEEVENCNLLNFATSHNLVTPFCCMNSTSHPHRYQNTRPHVSHTDLYANDGVRFQLIFFTYIIGGQHSFARSQLRGSRKLNLATSHSLITPRSRTNLTSQLYECKCERTHTHTHTSADGPVYILEENYITLQQEIHSMERVSVQCCCIQNNVIEILDCNCNDLELGRFEVIYGQRSSCQLIAHGWLLFNFR